MTEAAEAKNEQGFSKTIETVDPVTMKATVSIPVERVSTEFEDALKRVQSSARIKGFRPGKAPRHIIEKMHGPRVRMDVANQLISSTLQEIIKELDETVVGRPEIELSSFEPGQEITYTANLAIFPKPEVSGYEKLEVTAPKREVTDDDIQKVVDNLLNSKASQKPVEGRTRAEKGDVISADLKEVGQAEEEASEPLVIAVGEGLLPDELDAEILGMEIGETKEVSISHGADAQCAEGSQPHTHTFKVTLNELNEKVKPELTDDFVKQLGFDGIETVLELKTDIRKRLEEEQAQISEEDVNSEIMKELLEHNKFQVPGILVEDEIRSLVMRAGQVDPNKVDAESFDIEPYRDQHEEAADKRVRMTIIVDQIADKEDLKAKDEDIEAYLVSVADKHNLPVEEVSKYFLDKSRAMGTFLEVTRNKVLKFLRDKAQVTFSESPAE